MCIMGCNVFVAPLFQLAEWWNVTLAHSSIPKVLFLLIHFIFKMEYTALLPHVTLNGINGSLGPFLQTSDMAGFRN